MSSNLTQDQPPAQDRAEPKLSGYGRVIVDTARTAGKIPRWHDGMTVEDGMIITGLPREEVLYHIHRILNSQTGNVSPDIYATLYLSEGASERRKLEPAKPAPQASAKIIQFPQLFGDYTRAVSNPLARCSLFAPVKTRGHFRDWVLIANIDGVKIEAKGEQWNQDDADALAQFVKMAMHKPFGEEVSVYVKAVLYELGRHTQKSQRLQLYRELDRLVTSSLKITMPNGAVYMGHIIEAAKIPPDMRETLPSHLRRITYRLNKDFARFYDSTLYTLYDQRKRLQLTGRGSELAKWLHLWIEGNAEQYAHKVETLRDKSGSTDKTLFSFRQKLRQALDILKAAQIIESWYITAEDLVLINRTPSETQQRHLTKKAAKEAAKKAPKNGKRRNKPAHVGELL